MRRVQQIIGCLLLAISAMSVSAQSFVHKDASGLYFRCDPNTMTAALIATQQKNAKKYRMESIVVPATVTVEQGTISTGGTSQDEMVFTVTEVEANALKDATA